MEERYKQLYKFKDKHYQKGAPVMVIAGALLKDTTKNTVLAQVKLKSISNQIIKAVKVLVQPLSTFGEPLGGEIEHHYLDITVKRDDEFGQKEPIFLPDTNTRQFRVHVTEVAFENKTTWQENDALWEQIESPIQLNEALNNDPELVKQYKEQYGKDSIVFPLETSQLWYCNCGGINSKDEDKCHVCGKGKAFLFGVDIDQLTQDKENRLKDEAYEKAELLSKKDTVDSLKEAHKILSGIPEWKDAKIKTSELEVRIEELTRKAEAEQERLRIAAKRKKKIATIIGSIAAAMIVFAIVLVKAIIPNSNYNKAVALMENGDYNGAITAFEALNGYKDSAQQIEQCKTAIKDDQYDAAIALKENGDYEGAIAAFKAIDGHKDSAQQIEQCKTAIKDDQYDAAIALKENGDYEGAIAAFEAMDGYKDSEQQAEYTMAEAYLSDGNIAHAAMAFYAIGNFSDARERCFELWETINQRKTIAVGGLFTVVIKTDGTCDAVGSNAYGQCDINKWKDIISVSAGGYHTVGLKSDNTVVAVGNNDYNQCNVKEWKKIIAVFAGGYHTVGLKENHSVVTTKVTKDIDFGQCDLSNWTDIVSISAGVYHTVGLKADGTVVATGYNDDGQCNVEDWKDIVSVSAGEYHTVGLKADGTVVVTGSNENGKSNVSNWKNITTIEAGIAQTVGITDNNTVVAVGYNEDGRCNASAWKDIVAIDTMGSHIVGLKSDGTVVAAGSNEFGQCDVSDWTDIKLQ